MSKATQKNENTSSKVQRIEITIRLFEVLYIKEILSLYFHYDDSPTYPVCILFDGLINHQTGEARSSNFRIVEFGKDKDQQPELLATIGINPFPSHIVVFIEPVKEDNPSWEKIKGITKEIITKMGKLDYKIESVKPAELLPISSLHPWEQIPEHFSDRKIVELWWKGYTYNEIGKKVSLSPPSIGNVLSNLRKEHGTDIVPTNDQRKARNG